MQDVLTGFVQAVERAQLTVHNVIVLQDGVRIAERHLREDVPKNQYSASKSFVSAAVGFALHEGLLSLEDRVVDRFPGVVPEHLRDVYSPLTLRHLLTMSIGQPEPMLMREQRCEYQQRDWARLALSEPLGFKPGERFLYSNANTYLAAVMLQKAAGRTLLEYLRPRLFGPLGFQDPEWASCPLGYTFGASDLVIRTRELAKLGQLHLQGGMWEGARLLPQWWVTQATSRQIATPEVETGADWLQGYGYYFWRGTHDSYRADGWKGQFCVVIPSVRAVVAINSDDERMQQILDCLWSELLPALRG